MSDEKHTPGPWSACHDGNCSCGYIFGDGGSVYVAKALSLDDDVDPVASDEYRRGNVKLIVAALNSHAPLTARVERLEKALKSALSTLEDENASIFALIINARKDIRAALNGEG